MLRERGHSVFFIMLAALPPFSLGIHFYWYLAALLVPIGVCIYKSSSSPWLIVALEYQSCSVLLYRGPIDSALEHRYSVSTPESQLA